MSENSSETGYHEDFQRESTALIDEHFSHQERANLTTALQKFVINPEESVVHAVWESEGLRVGITAPLTAEEIEVIIKADDWDVEGEITTTDVFQADGRFDPMDIMILRNRVDKGSDEDHAKRVVEETRKEVGKATPKT